MPDGTIRVIVADDHAIVLHGLETLFQRTPDIEVVACCRSGEQALAALHEHGADVLVLDLRMPSLSGLDVLRRMQAERHTCRTVLLTATIGDSDTVEAMRLGAMGLVLKESSPDVLIECVRRVFRGQQWIDRQTMGRALERALRREQSTQEVARLLTPREIEIVRMIAQGHRNRALAERLAISEGTVKLHLHNIYQKLGIDGRLELAIWAQARELT